MISYLRAHSDEEKPPLPYTVGAILHAQLHHPPAPPDDHAFFLSRDLKQKITDVHPLQICLEHQPMSAADDQGGIKFQISSTVLTGDNRSAQLVKVRILDADASIAPLKTLPRTAELVAKFYDPLYAEIDYWGDDFLQGADSSYAHEAQAFHHIKSLYGKVVPLYYGSYSVKIPVPHRHHSPIVRMILEEVISASKTHEAPGKSLNNIDPLHYSQIERQSIMAAIIRADSMIRLCDVIHGDLHPRNIMLLHVSGTICEAPVYVVDLDLSTCGYLSELSLIPMINSNGHRPQETATEASKRWTQELNEETIDDFRDWIDWDWDRWVRHTYSRQFGD